MHPPKPKYKKRAEIAEEEIVVEYLSSGPGKEDVQMFKLALARLLGEGEELVTGVRWAHYPDNILSIMCVCVEGGWGYAENVHVPKYKILCFFYLFSLKARYLSHCMWHVWVCVKAGYVQGYRYLNVQ